MNLNDIMIPTHKGTQARFGNYMQDLEKAFKTLSEGNLTEVADAVGNLEDSVDTSLNATGLEMDTRLGGELELLSAQIRELAAGVEGLAARIERINTQYGVKEDEVLLIEYRG